MCQSRFNTEMKQTERFIDSATLNTGARAVELLILVCPSRDSVPKVLAPKPTKTARIIEAK